MMKKMNEILKDVDNQFVEEYETILIYKKNLDDTLEQMGFNGFNSYNEFCLMVRNNIIKSDTVVMNKQIFSQVLNKTLRDKIKEDVDYESKLLTTLGDPEIINFMKNSIDNDK